MIGPNGAGKSTVFNVITGVYEPTAGDVRFAGELDRRQAPHGSPGSGSRAPSRSLRLFLNMSVKENVKAATYGHTKASPPSRSCGCRAPAARSARSTRWPTRSLSFFGAAAAWATAGTSPRTCLSYANRRRLEIARALATVPRLLLLDEPAAGMNPNETHEVTELISRLRDELGLDDPRDRARHARRRGDLRPRGRARPRRQDHRGHLRAGRDAPGVVEAYLGRDPEALAEA